MKVFYTLCSKRLTKNLLIAAALLPIAGHSQQQTNKQETPEKKKKHFIKEVYFSWGYNTEWYTHSNVHIRQGQLGNDYTFEHVRGHDHKGWDEGLFTEQLSIPQYNYRLGFLLDDKRGWGFEINFDHTKYIFADQNVHIKGILTNHPVDSTVAFNESNGFYYYLNNGANFLLFNVTKQSPLYQSRSGKLQVDFLGKFGVGPVIPHVQNSLFGQKNVPGFQFGGWNMGLEGCLRATFFKHVYLEYSNKLDFADYKGLQVYEGKASQSFGVYEMILSLGIRVPTGHKK